MTTVTSAAPPTPRVAALDGLRGVTIILVVLGHAGNLLWPTSSIDTVRFLRSFFHGGAVSVFFVVGGYIVTRGLLRELDRGTFDAVRFYLRRLVRLGVQVVPLAGVILLLHAFDPTDPYSTRATVESAINVVTHTTNLHAASDLLSTRPDLGHMWYLAVQQQIYLALPFLLLFLFRRKWLLAVVLFELLVASAVWRYRVLETDGWIDATITTLARADTVLAGALVAVGAVAAARWRHRAPVLVTVGGIALLVLMASLQEVPGAFQYLKEWGLFFTAAAAVTVLGIALLERPTPVSRMLSVSPLTWLGRASLAIFVWHLPLFVLVERHTKEWTWLPRTVTAFSLLALVAWSTHRYLDDPARNWLKTHLRPVPLRTPHTDADDADDHTADEPVNEPSEPPASSPESMHTAPAPVPRGGAR